MKKETVAQDTQAIDMPEAQETALATTGTTELAPIPEGHLLGMETMDAADIQLPNARLIQPIMTSNEKYEGQRPGTVVNDVLNEVMPDTLVPLMVKDDKIMFVPQRDEDKPAFRARIKAKHGVELTDDDMKSPYLCRAKDNLHGDRFGLCSQCGLCEWEGNNKPLCNKNINVMAQFGDQPIPAILRFNATSYKHGRKFKQAVFMSRDHVFAKRYKLGTTKKQEGTKVWYEMALTPAGNLTAEEKLEAYKMYTDFGPIFAAQLEKVETAAPVEATTAVDTTEY